MQYSQFLRKLEVLWAQARPIFNLTGQTMLRSSLVILASAVALGGCGDKSAEQKKVATQVAAKVNSEEISVHQINNVLSRAGSIKPEQAKQAGRQVLDKLIEQELLIQQAVEKKLDRDPRVMQAIEASRREILAKAYLEQASGGVAKPDDAAIKAFYDRNPALFSERRIYNLQEVVIAAKPEQAAAIQELLRQAKSMNDLLKYLKDNNIQFNANAGVKTAEQLPMEVLPKLHELKDGQTALLPSPAGLTLVHIAGSQQRPLDEAAAKPFIEQYLSNQKRAELAAAEIKQLKDKAKIEYVGEFAQSQPGTPGDSARSQPPAAPAAEVKPADKALEKGIQGLK